MIKDVKITNYLGDELIMELARPEKSGFAIKSIEGLSPGKSNVNITEVVTMDGGKYNSSRMEARNIVFNLIYQGIKVGDELNDYSIEYIRQLSYKYFPLKRKITICINTDNRKSIIDGIVEKNEVDIFNKEESAQISVVCPNPFFYDGDKIDTTTLYGVEPLFEFPFSNENLVSPLINFGEIRNSFIGEIEYHGDDEVGIIMRIIALGPASGIRIYNLRTREVFRILTEKIVQLTGSPIGAGDEIEISTEKGNKYAKLIRNGIEINILNSIYRESTWFQLARGTNQFGFVASYGQSNLLFTISNKILYEGV